MAKPKNVTTTLPCSDYFG